MNPETAVNTTYPSTEFAMEQQIQPAEALLDTLVAAERASLWDRAKVAAGRVALAGVVALGITVASETIAPNPAMAASRDYGDYLTGQYPQNTHCAEDADTIATVPITRDSWKFDVNISNEPGISISTDGNVKEIGTLILRWSEECGTAWTVYNGKSASGINFIGVQHDGHYTQKKDIGGYKNGSPAGRSISPMIYSRDRVFQAFVEAKDRGIAYRQATSWADPAERE